MSMMSVTRVSETRRARKESPLGLYIAVIKENALSSESAHKASFKKLVLSEGYEDFVEAIITEWQSIKYSTALRAAKPPGLDQIKVAAAQRKKNAENEKGMVNAAKKIIGSRVLELVMPNGKRFGDCTGAECLALGGFCRAIGEKIGPKDIVRDTLSTDDIGAIAKRTKAAT